MVIQRNNMWKPRLFTCCIKQSFLLYILIFIFFSIPQYIFGILFQDNLPPPLPYLHKTIRIKIESFEYLFITGEKSINFCLILSRRIFSRFPRKMLFQIGISLFSKKSFKDILSLYLWNKNRRMKIKVGKFWIIDLLWRIFLRPKSVCKSVHQVLQYSETDCLNGSVSLEKLLFRWSFLFLQELKPFCTLRCLEVFLWILNHINKYS